MPVMNGGFFNGPTDIKEYHIGYLNSGPVDNTGALQGGTGNGDRSGNIQLAIARARIGSIERYRQTARRTEGHIAAI